MGYKRNILNFYTLILFLSLGALFACPAMADTESKSITEIDTDTSAVIDTDEKNINVNDTDESVAKTQDTDVPMSDPVATAPLKDEIAKDKMPSISVTVSPKKGAIGDLIEWKVEVKKKTPEDRVVLPATLDFGRFEIQSRDMGNDNSDEKSMTQHLGVGLVAFETGEFDIPPQKLTVVDDKGNLSEVMTKAFTVTIKSLIANEPEPAMKVDEKDGEVVMVEDYTLVYVGIGLLAVLLIVLITLVAHKLSTMYRPRRATPPPPPRPAHITALEKLNKLKNAGYLDEQMHKVFHLKLSEAFREYLGNRYHFDALEHSTHEIIDELKRISLNVELHREVVQLLEDTDLVKFAKYEPPKEESEALLDEAFRIVDITKAPMESDAATAVDKNPVDGGMGGGVKR